jgi:hypothetical protein
VGPRPAPAQAAAARPRRQRGAIALYRRLGYEVEGVLRDQVAVARGDGGARAYEDEWIMARHLTTGDA